MKNHRKARLVLSAFVTSLLLYGCNAASIKTLPVSEELAAHPVSVQAIGHKRTTKDLKGNVRTAELISVDNDLSFYKTTDGYEWTNYANPMMPSPSYSGADWGKGTQVISKADGALFPLVVGNKMSFVVNGKSSKSPEGWSESRKCEVTSQERVVVEAGEFDAFKVICSSEWRKRTFFFSPKVNDIVLYRNIHKTEPQKNSGWELMYVDQSSG